MTFVECEDCSTCQCSCAGENYAHERSLLAHATTKLVRANNALRKIRDLDYRGNRHESSEIARRALEDYA